MWQKKITFTCSMCMHNEQLNSKRTIKKHKIFNNIAIQCSRNVNHWNGTLTFRITTTHNFYAFSIEKKQDLFRDMNKNKTPCPISFLFPVPFAFWRRCCRISTLHPRRCRCFLGRWDPRIGDWPSLSVHSDCFSSVCNGDIQECITII